MAGKKGQDNYDALGSVFDFIFTEAKKPPDRRKPIKPTGIAGDSMLTDALAASLEKPGAFISDTVVSEFNDALDIELSVSPYKGVGKLKVTSNSLIDFLKDPEGYVDKSLKTTKAIRKSARLQFLGQDMADFLASGWAQKYGNVEVRNSVRGIVDARERERIAERNSKFGISKAVGEYAASTLSKRGDKKVPSRFEATGQSYMTQRAGELTGRRLFGTERWNDLTDKERNNFLSNFIKGMGDDAGKGTVNKDQVATVLVGLARNPTEAQELRNNLESFFNNRNYISDEGKFNLWNAKTYKSLEDEDLSIKINSLPEGDEDRKMFEKTQLFLRKDLRGLKDKVSELRRDIASAGSADEREQLKLELKETSKAIDAINGADFFGRIGKWEGYYNSLKNIYTGGNLAPSILTGAFFDKNKNKFFNPVQEENLALRGRKYAYMEVNDASNVFVEGWNAMGTQLYYITPRSMFRTVFYNGEAFQYLLGKEFKILEAIDKSFASDVKEVFKKKLSRGEFDAALESILGNAGGNLSPENLERFAAALSRAKSLEKVVHTFSLPFRLQSHFNDFFAARTQNFRKSIENWILTNPKLMKFFADNTAGKLLSQWAAKGGVDVFVRSLVTAIASSFGTVIGPVGNLIIGALTWIATDALFKVGAFFFNVFKYIAIGVVGLFLISLVSGGVSLRNFNTRNYLSHNVIPTGVGSCNVYETIELKPGEPSPWGPAIIPPPSGEDCPLGPGSISCTQGWVDNISSHKRITQLMPVDLGFASYIYAPQFCDTGDCKITSIGRINCLDGTDPGGAVIFVASTSTASYTFKMYHVKPLASLNEKLSSGQPVAVVQLPPEVEKGDCWTGAHLHLEMKQNDAVVDPLELLQKFNCGVPSESGCM